MPIVHYGGNSYSCATALKGEDYIRLLDENNVLIVAFEKVANFSLFTIESGEWAAPQPEKECPLVIRGSDGISRPSKMKLGDIGGGDWNQNNANSPDYIKNRICYEETTSSTRPQTLSGILHYASEGYFTKDVWVEVKEGRSNYTINGEPAQIITIEGYTNETGAEVQGIESASWKQAYYASIGQLMWYSKTSIAESTEMTITYYEEITETKIHHLDEKFIPNTIARTSMIGDINTILDNINGEVI